MLAELPTQLSMTRSSHGPMAADNPEQRRDSIAGFLISLFLAFFGRQLDDQRQTPVDSDRWNNELAEDLFHASMQIVQEEGEQEIQRFGSSGFDNGWTENYLAKGSLLMAQGINEATADLIEKLVDDGMDPTDARNSVLEGETAQSRANTYANGKAQHLQSFSSMEAAKQEGSDNYTKTWIWSKLPNSRHEMLSGQTVPVYMPFSNGLQYPHDPSGRPGQTANCRCSMIVNGAANLEVLEGR